MLNTLIGWTKNTWYFFSTFFPVQLFLLHVRRSHIVLIFWLLLFAFTGGWLGSDYGLQYLFMSPEYLDKVSFVSYVLMGVTSGLFIMAFHISSYIYYSYRYPFLATLSRPLWKFSLNNSLIPVLFYLFYIYRLVRFSQYENLETSVILINIASLLGGAIVSLFLTFTYFFNTLQTLELPDDKKSDTANPLRSIQNIIRKDKELKEIDSTRFTVNFYLRTPLSIKLARRSEHYHKNKLLETIQQHHFSASVYFVILILITIGLGLVSNYKVFMIPAGATIFLIFSLYLMITGAFYSQLKTWTLSIGVAVILVLNYLSGLEVFKTEHYAYGMDYEGPHVEYSYHTLDSLTTDSLVNHDKQYAVKHLRNWRSKFSRYKKPKLVILNVSGGGLRSTLWTMKVLQEADSATNGKLFEHCHLINGSSGGMLGAAYFRELKYSYRNKLLEVSPYHKDHLKHISKDILNPVAFTLAVNDLFFRIKDVDYGHYSYPLDRGYAFDKRFDENTEGLLNKEFGHYGKMEFEAEIPTLILSPTIIGDGRKLLMSNQPFSYLTFTRPYSGIRKEKEYDGVEFLRLFEKQQPHNLSFITALRMSASFPYITPLVNLPSEPPIELIDAGVRDNEGLELSLRYLYHLEDWLRRNTSGVVIVQVKANRPDEIPIKKEYRTKLDQLILPLGGVVESFHNLQIYDKSLLMQLSKEYLNLPVEIVRFSLFQKKDEVSLSWHLTEKEKANIEATFYNEMNQQSLRELQDLLQ